MGIKVMNISKRLGNPPNQILSDISFEISDGEYIAVTGRSGSGKSSLLYVLSTLDRASEGMVEIDGTVIERMTNEEISLFRNAKAGFVFQFHYLFSELSAIDNILLPAGKTGQRSSRLAYGLELLREFGLVDKKDRFPRQLSGGEQQRIAIARALIMEPRYLFADEPTGLLDSENSEIVLRILKEINQKRKTTVIFVTHDLGFASRAERQIHLVDGRLAGDV